MTGLNHAITGIAIAVSVKHPLLAPLLALASHFLLDMVPHFGHPAMKPGSRFFRNVIVADGLGMIIVTVTAMWLFPQLDLLIGACAFLAFAPDIVWYYKYFRADHPVTRALHGFMNFAMRIQWYEKPPGAIVEAVHFVVIVWVISLYR
ncbi:hypothetical protein JNJ66_02095 [Candidatus Saccharibacteria bacterium]|nr:hypothetical protein [Candidatus Saccharibacteria bacterium]